MALGLAAVMAVGFSSCDTYDIYPEQYGKVMSIKNSGDRDITVYTTDPTSSDTIIVMKGGHNPEGVSKVSLRAMNDADWAAYVEETRNEGLLRIPMDCYSFDAEADMPEVIIDFKGDKERYAVKRFYVKSQPFAAWYNTESVSNAIAEGRIPVIPVILSPLAEGDSVSADNMYVFYHPNLTAPQLGMTSVGANVKLFNQEDCGEGKIYTPDVKISLPSQLLWDFSISTLFNATALDKYKAAHSDASDWVLMEKSWFSYDESLLAANGGYIDTDANKTKTTYHFKKGGDKALGLGINIDLSYFDPEKHLNTTFVIPLTLIKKVTFEEPGLSAEENEKLAQEVGLTCQADTILVSFRVDKIYNLHELAIDETMVTSNCCEPNEGSIAGLFDDDTNTFFHSIWSGSVTTTPEYGGYLEIDVPEEGLNMCGFEWTNRVHSNPGYPVTVAIYGSTDGEDWWKFGEMDNCQNSVGTSSGSNGTIGDARHPFISRNDDGSARPFSKVRFCVLKSKNGAITTTCSNSNYFNLSEFRMSGGKE